jgi:Ca-activated chloride channel family protein
VSPSLDPAKDYYALLQVSETATGDEIRTAFRELARRFHPDSSEGDAERFRSIREAYEVLSDAKLRRAYERQRVARGLNHQAPLTLSTQVSRQNLSAVDARQMLYLLVDVRPQPDGARAGKHLLDLALVVDRSTSMQGRRMRNVKAAAQELLDVLGPEDRLSLVAFSDRAEVLSESVPVQDKHTLHAAIARLHAEGGTEIYQGLLAGLNQLRKQDPKQYLSHLILLTDGRTYGDEQLALQEVQRAADEGIGVSALGIGEDWNDIFLDQLARYGNGVCEYIRSPSQVRELLQAKVRQLSSVFLRGLRLHLNTAPYVEVSTVYQVEPNVKEVKIQPKAMIPLGDLGEETLALILELEVHQPQIGERRLARLHVLVDAEDGEGLAGVRQDVTVNFVSGTPDPEPVPIRLLSLLSRQSVFRLQERAWQALENGNADQATHLLESAATRLFDMGHRQLARAAMLEARRVSQRGQPTSSGRKQLRYGTRSLSIRRED